MPKGIKWTSRCSSNHILSEIAAFRDVVSHRKMIVHADDAGLHVEKRVTEYMNQNSLRGAPHGSIPSK
jgi:hypothetical protein